MKRGLEKRVEALEAAQAARVAPAEEPRPRSRPFAALTLEELARVGELVAAARRRGGPAEPFTAEEQAQIAVLVAGAADRSPRQ